MNAPTCFAVGPTAFTARHVHIPALSSKRAPRVSFYVLNRRTRASAVEPGTEAAPEADKAVETVKPTPVSDSEPPVSQSKSGEADEPVPGKIVLDEVELARQRTELEKYTAELRRERLKEEREASRLFGWVPFAENLNGRLAMFFFMTGLLTEYWTGYSIPEQIELMARTLGIL